MLRITKRATWARDADLNATMRYFKSKIMNRKVLLTLSVLLCFAAGKLHAQSEWLGKWHSAPIEEDSEKVIMEYDFKDESAMSMAFFTDNYTARVGRCVSKLSIKGTYNKVGPFFFISLDTESLNVEIVKLEASNSYVSREKILNQLKLTGAALFYGHTDVSMIYVQHESPDTISFVFGDGDNAMDLVLHRPSASAKKNPFPNSRSVDIARQIASQQTNPATGNQPQTKAVGTGESNQMGKMWEDTDKKPVSTQTITTTKDRTRYHDLTSKKLSPMAEMWKNIGLFMLYLIFSYALIGFMKFLFIKNISRGNTAQKSVMIRIIYFTLRFIVRIILVLVGLVFLGLVIASSMQVNQFIAVIALLGGGGLFLSLLSTLSLPIYFMTMKQFLSKERSFVMYLRGFITDDYSPKMGEIADEIANTRPWTTFNAGTDPKKQEPNKFPLNEKALATSWKNRDYQVYSVGLPEELESPEGSKRVYLDNETWQEDALTLMKLADYILIRVHTNPNCIWEIEQCDKNFPDKTIYYIEDIKKFNSVKEQMGDNLPKCLRSYTLTLNHMVAYLKDGEVITRPYVNNEFGLSAISREVMSV